MVNELHSEWGSVGIGGDVSEAAASDTKKRVVKPPAERRREILEAALDLFSTKGFDETTVQDIAGAAGVAIGTVYLYFSSKEHVLLGLHDDFNAGMHEGFGSVFHEVAEKRARGEDVPDGYVIDSVLDLEVEYCLEHTKALEVIARYSPRPEIAREALARDRLFVQAMADSFMRGMDKGSLHTSDAEMTAYLLSAAISTTLTNSIVYGEPADRDRLFTQAKELFRKALAPPT
jgi:AcrR family transcriptional regulator